MRETYYKNIALFCFCMYDWQKKKKNGLWALPPGRQILHERSRCRPRWFPAPCTVLLQPLGQPSERWEPTLKKEERKHSTNKPLLLPSGGTPYWGPQHPERNNVLFMSCWDIYVHRLLVWKVILLCFHLRGCLQLSLACRALLRQTVRGDRSCGTTLWPR